MNSKNLILSFSLIVILDGLTSNVYSQLPSSDPAYQLVFNEEFLGTQIDYNKWKRIPDWNQGSNFAVIGNPPINVPVAYKKWKTNIPGQMDTTNCKVSNGTVKLYTRKENYIGEVWDWPNNVFTVSNLPFKFTTAMLISKTSFRYGYYEIRFRLPSPPPAPKRHLGFGPNFWFFGADVNGTGGWKNYWSEIDVFEINSIDPYNNQSNFYTNNVHYRNCNNSSCHIQDGNVYGYITNNVWHTAATNWTPSKIEFYLDGVKIRDFPCNQLNLPPDSLVKMPILIDVNAPALNFGTAFDTTSANGTAFPYVYEIDYVKGWQLKQACDTPKIYCNFLANTYNSKLYKSITIGGLSCTSNIVTQNNLSFYGKDFVLLNEGFSIDATSNVTLNTEKCDLNYIGLKTSNTNNQTKTPMPPPPAYIERQNRRNSLIK